MLSIKKLLDQRIKGEIVTERFSDDYLAQIIEAREIKSLAEDDY